jgi:HNH endonuclease
MSSKKVSAIVGRTIHAVERKAHKLGLRKTAEYLASPDACRLRRGDQVGKAFRYPKGHVPANKGLRRPGWHVGRMRETQFKKGERTGAAQAKWCPVGTIKMRDGFLMMKVKDEHQDIAGKGAYSTNWMYVHKMVWESKRGMISRGHRIWWKDGNHENCAIENLELLSGVEHMKRTTIQNWPAPLKQVAMLTGALKRKIKTQIRKRRTNDRAEERGNKKQTVRSA